MGDSDIDEGLVDCRDGSTVGESDGDGSDEEDVGESEHGEENVEVEIPTRVQWRYRSSRYYPTFYSR